MVAPAGEIEADDELQIGCRHVPPRSQIDFACACGNRGNLRVPPSQLGICVMTEDYRSPP